MKSLDAVLPDLKLRFNLSHPTYEECYAYGYACALASVALDDNPYQPGTRLWEQWDEGWQDGFYGQAPLFELDWLTTEAAMNEPFYTAHPYVMTFLKITGTLAASLLLGYQLFDWAA